MLVVEYPEFSKVEEIEGQVRKEAGLTELGLNYFNLCKGGGLSLESLEKVVKAGATLTTLSLYDATALSEGQLKQLFDKCPKLTAIELWLVDSETKRPSRSEPLVLKRT